MYIPRFSRSFGSISVQGKIHMYWFLERYQFTLTVISTAICLTDAQEQCQSISCCSPRNNQAKGLCGLLRRPGDYSFFGLPEGGPIWVGRRCLKIFHATGISYHSSYIDLFSGSVAYRLRIFPVFVQSSSCGSGRIFHGCLFISGNMFISCRQLDGVADFFR